MAGADAAAARAQTIRDNCRSVRERIAAAARRAGRAPESIRLIAVTKGRTLEDILALHGEGVREMGENRIQNALPQIAALPSDITWHLIGHLQRNKAKTALQHFRTIHAVDSVRLGEELEKQAARLADAGALDPAPFPILLEVNISGEESKFGFRPEDAAGALDAARAWPHLRVEGLMTMAPYDAEAETTRPVFRGLRELRDALRGSAPALAELSMGMSNDFEVAIEEGATMVRIGGALFVP